MLSALHLHMPAGMNMHAYACMHAHSLSSIFVVHIGWVKESHDHTQYDYTMLLGQFGTSQVDAGLALAASSASGLQCTGPDL